MNITKGYAVVEHGNIDMRTVYPTRRGAVVNWLVVKGERILDSMTDAEIEEIWSYHVQHHGFDGQLVVHKVLVSVEQ